MSDASIVIADGDGASVLAAINAAFDTLNTVHAGATAPAELVVGMLWADTANSQLKRLTSTGPAVWTTLGTLAANMGMLRIDGSNQMTGALDQTSAAPASASTLAITGGNLLQPSGTTTITALGTAQAGAVRRIHFTTALQLTHSANFYLPGAANITTASGDIAEFVCTVANTTWKLANYTRADGGAVFNGPTLAFKGADITAAATTNLATATGDYVVVSSTGTIAISALGTVQAGTVRKVTFSIASGTLSITHNATSLILPGGSNISVTTGDSAEFVSLGSGNWRCTSYQPNTLTAKLWQVVTSASVSPSITSSGQYLICTATANVTLALPAAAADYLFAVSNRCSAGIKVTIDPNGAQLVDGLATTDLYPGSAAAYISDGTGWKRMDTGVVASEPSYANNSTHNNSGTWIVPASVYEARMTVIGSGGAGGGGLSTGGSGGGGGGLARKTMSVTPGDTYTITIGAGGVGVSNDVGGNGGTCSISGPAGTITATGGTGGAASAGAVGTGGTGSGGTVNVTGGSGGLGRSAQGGGGGGGGSAAGLSGGSNNGSGSATQYAGGAGGEGSGGTAGTAGYNVIGGNGGNSTGPESGGGGGASGVTAGIGNGGAGGGAGGGGGGGAGYGVAATGGNGAPGRVYIEW